tara:strand:+ start:144 stop:563 length:420 start_codon:yes stop_codon:yes gene_type:complete
MKIGITCSAFDLLHTGHIVMLQEAKTVCDYLICALQVDPSKTRKNKNTPSQTIVERQIQLSAVKYVDEIIVYETEEDLENIFASLKIDIRIIGEEYKQKNFTAKDICKKRNIQIYYNDRKHNFSSTNLKKFIRKQEGLK